MFEVTVTGWFAAAHQLRLPKGMEPLHGHNWKVAVTFRGDSLDEHDLLVDFTAIQAALQKTVDAFHDRNLNDVEAFKSRNSSAERVAAHIAEQLAGAAAPAARLHCVEVEEAPGCIARYYPSE